MSTKRESESARTRARTHKTNLQRRILTLGFGQCMGKVSFGIHSFAVLLFRATCMW